MTYTLIRLEDVSLIFPHKVCFSSFTTSIRFGVRIGLMGQNGSGKSSFLDILRGARVPTEGKITRLKAFSIGFVPQIISDLDSLSGAQKFNVKLTEVLAQNPDLLLLDEPTNHLDARNRGSLFTLLSRYAGTLILASHDEEILRTQVSELWDIRDGKIHIFRGNYTHYLEEQTHQRYCIEATIDTLKKEEKNLHETLMKEQNRASKSRQKGQKSISERKWPTIVSRAKAGRAQKTFGKHKFQIGVKKEGVKQLLALMPHKEIVTPKFCLSPNINPSRALVSIVQGSMSYGGNFCVNDINLSIMPSQRVAICGANGSGKSTLLKALLNDPLVEKSGGWSSPKREDIGYLDQNYQTLSPNQSVLENLHQRVPHWNHEMLRKHLNGFLFSKTEHVLAKVQNLSGGEKARLSLALIAALPPKLLILDEVTNNLDLINRAHLIQILKRYPGTFIVVSHDSLFLREIDISHIYDVQENH